MVHLKHRTRGAAKIEMRGEPRFRSRRGIRRVQRKTPGGKTVVHYKKKAPGKPLCAICKNYLHGLPRGIPAKIKKMPRTQLTIQRPFGGMLCSECSRKIISLRAKLKFKEIKSEDVPISLRSYL